MSTRYTHAVVLDFEATCDGRRPPRPQEIIEFPSVLFALEDREIVDEFAAFVRPHHHPTLTDFCTSLTSIVQADVDAADLFADVFARHQAWLAGHGLDERTAIIVTCGDWDLGRMMPGQCTATVPPITEVPLVYAQWHNIKRMYCTALGRAKAPGMRGMMRALELPMVGRHHRGLDDCRNIVTILETLLDAGGLLEVTAERHYPKKSGRGSR